MSYYCLRDYQQDMLARIRDAFDCHRSVMVQMPTGTGKTVVLASLVHSVQCLVLSVQLGCAKILIVAHRRELVEQIRDTIHRLGIDDRNIIVCSIQWLARHFDEVREEPRLVIVDEAHHALARTYREMWRRWEKARFLGLTATPCRMNGKGFTELFDTLVTSWSIAEFIGQGVLSTFDYVGISKDSDEQRLVDSLKKRGADGDYQAKEMAGAFNNNTTIERLYCGMRQYAAGRKGIVYAVNIGHARAIAGYYCGKGVRSVAIDSRTPEKERRECVEAFRKGTIDVLVNVDIFSEGFDCPDVEFVQMARPTLSLAKYMQMVGRGLRKAEGKETCVMIDCVGLHRRFGLPTEYREWQRMFEGKATEVKRENYRIGSAEGVGMSETYGEEEEKEGGMYVVVSHEHLPEMIEREREEAERRRKEAERKEKKQWRFRLRRKDDGRTEIVDEDGRVAHTVRQGVRVTLTEDDVAKIGSGRETCYTDLRNGNRIRPENRGRRTLGIMRFGNRVEILNIDRQCYTRTKKAMGFTLLTHRSVMQWRRYYLAIYHCQMRTTMKRPKQNRDSIYMMCIFDDEPEEIYTAYMELPDGRMIVYREGTYYVAEEGKERKPVAWGNEGIEKVAERLRRQAVERKEAETGDAEERLMKETEGREVMIEPFRMGTRWGLRTSEGKVVVRPVYRKVYQPVDGLCAFMNERCDIGVMTVAGRVVIEPRYMKAEVMKGGMVNVMRIPGKWEVMKMKNW